MKQCSMGLELSEGTHEQLLDSLHVQCITMREAAADSLPGKLRRGHATENTKMEGA